MKFIFPSIFPALFTVATGTVCERPESFLDFSFPVTNAPFTGEFTFYGDKITGGSVQVDGTLDASLQSNGTNGRRANMKLNELDLSDLYFVYDDELYDGFSIDNDTVGCVDCLFNAKFPADEISVCPLKSNLLLLLDGDLSQASGHAVKFIAKSLGDSVELEFNKSEAALVIYNEIGSSEPQKLATFADQLSNAQYRQLINSVSQMNAQGVNIPIGFQLAFEIFSTEARSGASDTLVFITDGFDAGAINPVALNTQLQNLSSITGFKIIIVAVAGDETTYRQILGCLPNRPCPDLILLEDISRASAEAAVKVAAEKICRLPPKSEAIMMDKNSATLFTFAVNDTDYLTNPTLQGIANAVISEASNEFNIDKSQFQVLDVQTIANKIPLPINGRALSVTNELSSGVIKIGLINDGLKSDPTALARNIGSQLSAKSSVISQKLRQKTGADVYLNDFEIKNFGKGGVINTRDGLSELFSLGNLIDAGDIGILSDLKSII